MLTYAKRGIGMATAFTKADEMGQMGDISCAIQRAAAMGRSMALAQVSRQLRAIRDKLKTDRTFNRGIRFYLVYLFPASLEWGACNDVTVAARGVGGGRGGGMRLRVVGGVRCV